MKLITTIIFLVIFIVALIFSILNFHSVSINFYFFSISMPLAVALTIELFAGIAIGFLVSGLNILKLKARYIKSAKSAK